MRKVFLSMAMLGLQLRRARRRARLSKWPPARLDAYKFCPWDVPDPDATEKCMRTYAKSSRSLGARRAQSQFPAAQERVSVTQGCLADTASPGMVNKLKLRGLGSGGAGMDLLEPPAPPPAPRRGSARRAAQKLLRKSVVAMSVAAPPVLGVSSIDLGPLTKKAALFLHKKNGCMQHPFDSSPD